MTTNMNHKTTLDEFLDLVQRATVFLNTDAGQRPEYYQTRHAQRLEDDVVCALESVAVGTPFEGLIEKVSGQRFPDIVVAKKFGIEVKSSSDENWTTLGGSVNESTRVPDVEYVVLMFGKLTPPVEFKSRPYQECLSDVVATHYPRYKINMNLSSGDTIFDKMGVDYDTLRCMENPVLNVIRYYRTMLQPGQRLWWFDDGINSSDTVYDSATVRLWNTLSTSERLKLIIDAYVLFPEILGSSGNKYDNLSLWLVTNHGVTSPALRDNFSAGGRCRITIKNQDVELSRTMYNLYQNIDAIKSRLLDVPKNILDDAWGDDVSNDNRIMAWLDIVRRVAPDVYELVRDIVMG